VTSNRTAPHPDPDIAADKKTWGTAVTLTAPGVIAPRGYPIEQLMGRVTFTEVVWLMYKGELPDERTRRLLDAVLVASIDHSTTSPSAMTARTVASSGAPVQLAATAGLLAINTYHGGALEPCMVILREVVQRARIEADPAENELPAKHLAAAAVAVVAEWRARGERLPGFGHRVHATDPRTDRLFEITDELGFHSVYQEAARAVERALNDRPDKRIPMNLDGAIAALFCALELPAELANPLFMTARFVGITQQAFEEHTRFRPMRKIDLSAWVYDGPALRTVPGDAR
jgi:citrate synthase